MEKQQKLQQAISCLSPSEIFRQVTETFCQTNAESILKYMESIRSYRMNVYQFFKDNRLFESAGYFTPQTPELILDNSEFILDMQHMKNLFENEKYAPESYPYLNVEDVPRFQSATTDVLALLNEALGSLLLLSLLTMLLLLGAIVCFMKYDVR